MLHVCGRYNTKLYNHGTMVVREFSRTCMRAYAWLVEVGGLLKLKKESTTHSDVTLLPLRGHTEMCCLRGNMMHCRQVCELVGYTYELLGFAEEAMSCTRLEACRTAAERKPAPLKHKSELTPPKPAEVSYSQVPDFPWDHDWHQGWEIWPCQNRKNITGRGLWFWPIVVF